MSARRTGQGRAGRGRAGDPSLIADALRDAANPSGEFDCARLRERLVGKYGEAKGGSIVESLLARSPVPKGSNAVCQKKSTLKKLH